MHFEELELGANAGTGVFEMFDAYVTERTILFLV